MSLASNHQVFSGGSIPSSGTKMQVDHTAKLYHGITGNFYVVSTVKSSIEQICLKISKSITSIYFSSKHNCWAIRVKNQKTKTIVNGITQMNVHTFAPWFIGTTYGKVPKQHQEFCNHIRERYMLTANNSDITHSVQGYFEINGLVITPTSELDPWEAEVANHLALVFKKVTPKVDRPLITPTIQDQKLYPGKPLWPDLYQPTKYYLDHYPMAIC